MSAQVIKFRAMETDSTERSADERVKILVVDDQPDNLLSAEAVLEGLGEEIVKAPSGREALRQLLDHDFAVILLDVMMPGMDGFETASLIRQRDRSRHTPIIFLTALGKSEEHLIRGYGVGAVEYLFKPIVPEVLRSKVAVFVELYRKSSLIERHSELLERRNSELQHAMKELEKAGEEIQTLNGHLERRIGELDAVNKELEAFSYSVSHDLRAPLRSIDGFSQVLLEDYGAQLDESGRDSLQRVRAASQRMAALIDDLLKLARVTRSEMRTELVDLSKIARDVVAELQRATPERQVEFVIAAGLETRGDARLLRVALENLLRNSWKYTTKQPRPRVEFAAVQENGERVFMVRDNGAGFDMQYADKLFGVFQRLHSAEDFEGTGVGLATVRRIITRHGGRIWAEAAVDRGATFYFTL